MFSLSVDKVTAVQQICVNIDCNTAYEKVEHGGNMFPRHPTVVA